MGFFTNWVKVKGQGMIESLQVAMVKFDPQTASEAEIKTLEQHFDKAAKELAEAENDYGREQNEAVAATTAYNNKVKVAQNLQNKINAQPEDDGSRANLEAGLDKVLGELEAMTPDVEREKQEAEFAAQVFEELKVFVQDTAQQLKSARSNLKQRELRLKQAGLEADRAEKQAERAKVLAGIKKEGGGKLNVALNAMDQAIEEQRIRAAAAQTKADLLGGGKPAELSEADKAIAEAEAEVTGAQAPVKSRADRVASLQTM